MLPKRMRAPVGRFPRRAPVVVRRRRFVVKKAKNNLAHSRVGVVIGRGAARRSATRNAIKRIVYRTFCAHPTLLDTPGADYLVVFNSVGKLDAELHGELTKELERAITELQNQTHD